MDPFDKVYPDTLQGAMAALDAMSSLDMEGATGYPDPQVDGVWKIEHPGQQNEPEAVASIVYLGGYNDPMGNKRHGNDFETEYDESVYQKADANAPVPNYDESEPDNYEENWDEGSSKHDMMSDDYEESHYDVDDGDNFTRDEDDIGEEMWTDFRLDAEPELFQRLKDAASRGDDPKKIADRVIDALVDLEFLKDAKSVKPKYLQSLVDYIAVFDETAE